MIRKLLLSLTLLIVLSSSVIRSLDGTASIYHNKFENRKTASGEVFHQYKLTCASNNFPLGSIVRVINASTGCNVIVKVNDRMAISSQMKGRIVDLSMSAAREINFEEGLTKVTVELI